MVIPFFVLFASGQGGALANSAPPFFALYLLVFF